MNAMLSAMVNELNAGPVPVVVVNVQFQTRLEKLIGAYKHLDCQKLAIQLAFGQAFSEIVASKAKNLNSLKAKLADDLENAGFSKSWISRCNLSWKLFQLASICSVELNWSTDWVQYYGPTICKKHVQGKSLEYIVGMFNDVVTMNKPDWRTKYGAPKRILVPKGQTPIPVSIPPTTTDMAESTEDVIPVDVIAAK